MVEVVNKYHHMETKSDVYIGRGSVLGNPYTHLESQYKDLEKVATRDEAIDLYADYANALMEFENDYSIAINKLRKRSKTESLKLVCYCKLPNKEVRCHGDIIKKLIEQE